MEQSAVWPPLLELWRSRRGRRAAVGEIAPLVERSRGRLNGISEPAWLDPYMVGFLIMLISLVARRKSGLADSPTLGLVQAEAWSEITGMKSDLIGEEVLHLSAAGHKGFEQGCRNAVTFDQALRCAPAAEDIEAHGWARVVHNPAASGGSAAQMAELSDSPEIEGLWARYFDAHVAPSPTAGAEL